MLNLLVNPRPEYPRPDRQRSFVEGIDWLNLNGPWQFRFDGERRGLDEQWFTDDQPEWREQIIVPFCWESLAAWGEADAAGNDNYYATRIFLNPLEVTKANHRSAPRYEVGWYRRRVQIPRAGGWAGKRAILTIGAADFFTDVWCNGVHLGRHEGGYTPFEFDLTDAIGAADDGWASLTIRVEDPMDNREQPVGKQWHWYTTTSGIWQTVFIEPRAASYVENFYITTEIEARTATLEIHCVEPPADATLIIEIAPPHHCPYVRVVPVTGETMRVVVEIDPLILWDTTAPRLYGLRLQLARGNLIIDTVHSYFGMRKIGTIGTDNPDAPSALSLNNEAIYLRGALHQSFYPEGVYTAGDVQTFKNDIAFAKRAGFDFLRIHIKVDDPLLYYYADTLGILLMVDFPNFGEGGDTPLGRSRFETMMRAAIRRDFNHPSIFAWCLFNETWGFGGQTELMKSFNPPIEPALPANGGNAPAEITPASWVQQTWELAKLLDPTRLIEDMSVVRWDHLDYYGHAATDINSWHFYIDDYERAKEHIARIVADTYAGSTLNYVTGFKQGTQPLINSEYGGVGALDGDRDCSWSFRFLTNELRRHPQLSAYIYTELHDVEWEYNGFLNYDRTAKEFGYDPTIVNSGDVLPIDAPPIQRCTPGQRMTIDIASSHYSRRKTENVLLQWTLTGVDRIGRMHGELARGSLPIAFPHRRVAPAHRLEIAMPETPMLASLSVRAIGSNGFPLAQNYVQFLVGDGYPPAREYPPAGTIIRAFPTDWSDAQWSGGMSDRQTAYTADLCVGNGAGFFEWTLEVPRAALERARRLRVLCEISAHRLDHPQTDVHRYPTILRISLNGLRVYEAIVPDHPHDTRGALSYLRGEFGAYGYLIHASVEAELLRAVCAASGKNHLRLRFEVPENLRPHGGLTIYGAECGRHPVCPTIIVES